MRTTSQRMAPLGIDVRDGKLSRTRARNGVEVKRSQLGAGLVEAMAAPAGPERAVKVPVTVIERPDRTLVDLAKRYPTVIGIDRDAKVLRLYENLKLKRRYKIAVGQAGSRVLGRALHDRGEGRQPAVAHAERGPAVPDPRGPVREHRPRQQLADLDDDRAQARRLRPDRVGLRLGHGMEKFFDIVCRGGGLTPDCVVLVATVRSSTTA